MLRTWSNEVAASAASVRWSVSDTCSAEAKQLHSVIRLSGLAASTNEKSGGFRLGGSREVVIRLLEWLQNTKSFAALRGSICQRDQRRSREPTRVHNQCLFRCIPSIRQSSSSRVIHHSRNATTRYEIGDLWDEPGRQKRELPKTSSVDQSPQHFALLMRLTATDSVFRYHTSFGSARPFPIRPVPQHAWALRSIDAHRFAPSHAPNSTAVPPAAWRIPTARSAVSQHDKLMLTTNSISIQISRRN